MKAMYFYGIIQVNENRYFGPIGIQNSHVHTIRYRDVAGVVSNIPNVIYEPTKENALTHEKVIKTLMENGSIIPMGFGTIAKNESDVEKILKVGYSRFKNLLKKIENKIQVEVKVLWETNKIYADILKKEKNILGLNKTILKKPLSRNKKIKLGKMVKSVLDKKRDMYRSEIKSVLFPLAHDSCENRLLNDKMIMNLSFLIDNDNETEFYKKINGLDEKYGDRIEVLGVGPLPPYNFTCMNVKRIDFKTIDIARKVLGLGIEAQFEDVEQAHRELAFKYHPDRNKAPSAERLFKQVENAYALLINYCRHHSSSSCSLCSFKKEDVEQTLMIM